MILDKIFNRRMKTQIAENWVTRCNANVCNSLKDVFNLLKLSSFFLQKYQAI